MPEHRTRLDGRILEASSKPSKWLHHIILPFIKVDSHIINAMAIEHQNIQMYDLYSESNIRSYEEKSRFDFEPNEKRIDEIIQKVYK